LLTLPWFLALLAGRVDLDGDGKPNYKKKLSKDATYTTSGAGVDESIKDAGKLMLVTCLLPYSIVQIPSWISGCGFQDCGCSPDSADFEKCKQNAAAEGHPYALIGLVVAGLLFLMYLVLQYINLEDGVVAQRKRFNTLIKSLKSGAVGVEILVSEFGVGSDDAEYGTMVKEGTFFHFAMKGMFKMYNTDSRGASKGNIDVQEMGAMLQDLHFPTSLRTALNKASKQSGGLTFEGLCKIVYEWAKESGLEESVFAAKEAEDDDEEEEEEMPDDILAEKDPSKQQQMIWLRSFQYMLGGTAVVLVFSDAMCDILSTLGERTGINSFYVAFVLAPLASNASELLAAKAYAEKKTQVTMTISLSSLLGAACMNNTFCLGIFLYQIYSNNLIWEFSAETLSIVFVQVIMAFFAFQSVQKAWWAFIIMSLFPLSVVLVWVLENIVKMD